MKKLIAIISFILFCFLFVYLILYSNNENKSILSNQKAQVLNSTEPKNKPPNSAVAEVQSNLFIDTLRAREFIGSQITIEKQLANRSNYRQYVVNYISEGNKIFGLLTVPFGEPPEGGYPAIVFNHGFIPPKEYKTTSKYVAYVDYLARNGFVVFKIDMRGHGNSEGQPTGTYFSPGYSIDSINALKSLQKLEYVNPNSIGTWGHSSGGNLVLRAMLVESDFKAGVIWGGAVYSYDDFTKYGLHDNSYRRADPGRRPREEQEIRNKFREGTLEDGFMKRMSLTENLHYLNAPVQLHHAKNDIAVNIAYSYDLVSEFESQNKYIELHEYLGGGHNITSPYFEQAMKKTVDFFKKHL